MHKKLLTAAVAACLGLVAACTPGSSSTSPSGNPAPGDVSTTTSDMGNVTLTLWDQEVRGGGNAQLTQLIASFEKENPNITINRVSRSFDDLVKTLRLALSGNDAPDVVQANNTRSQMGQFVQAGQLVNLDPYASAYGWTDRYPASVRAVASYSQDGKTFGEGQLYGLPQVGEVVGIYENKAKLAKLAIPEPTDWASFEKALATAKSKGETPLMLGNLDKWPAVHVFGVVQGQYVPAEEVRKLGYGNAGASWTTDANLAAATQLKDWVDKGYFNEGFNGLGYDAAWQQFSKGTGVFLIAGTWLTADLSAAMTDNVTFMLPPPAKAGGTTYTTGGSGLPFAITTKSEHPDAAAAFINHITTAQAMKVIAETGNLPVVDTGEQTAPDALSKDVFTAYDTATSNDGLLPYLDWATPTMSDTIGAGLQNLLGGQATPEQTLQTLEKDYSEFTSGS